MYCAAAWIYRLLYGLNSIPYFFASVMDIRNSLWLQFLLSCILVCVQLDCLSFKKKKKLGSLILIYSHFLILKCEYVFILFFQDQVNNWNQVDNPGGFRP